MHVHHASYSQRIRWIQVLRRPLEYLNTVRSVTWSCDVYVRATSHTRLTAHDHYSPPSINVTPISVNLSKC